MSVQEVILVDENDRETGVMEKMEVHEKGILHRAFSVFIINSSGHLLLQKRAAGKYHSPGLWTNTCCSHPKPGESLEAAASRRLMEEMGIGCELYKSFSFIYKYEFENGLTENEFDHVLLGKCDEVPVPAQEEVDEYKYVEIEMLEEELKYNPEKFTIWFRIAFPKVREKLKEFASEVRK